MATLQHPYLGKVQGKAGDGVVQYLGIKYGHLKDRFAEAVMETYDTESTKTATKVGPCVLQPPGAYHMVQSLIQHTLPFEDDSMSDLEGLNLNITIPESISSSKKLPVFVFIYGGGFMTGCGNWPENDFARIIKHSVSHGVPAIGVTFNYRVGIPGWLWSKELEAAGYKSNRGLRDQRLALEWVHKHISGFGGDADNITLFGESAGGISVGYHMQSEKPLFKRAMLMSGTALLMSPTPPEQAEHSYASALKILGLDAAESKDRISSLLSMPGLELLSKTGRSVHCGPVLDGEIITHSPTFKSVVTGSPPIAAVKWGHSFMVGDCAFDGSINSLRMGHKKSNIASTFTSSITSTLGSKTAQQLFDIYDLKSTQPDNEAFTKVLRFSNDFCFYAPTTAYAQGLQASDPNSKVYVYHFNEPNPWDGPYKGESNHVLDVAFLFLNFTEFLSAEQKAASEAFAEKFLKFVSGQAPWDQWKKGEGKAAVIEGGKIEVRSDVPEKVGRRAGFVKLADEIGFEKLNQAWEAFCG